MGAPTSRSLPRAPARRGGHAAHRARPRAAACVSDAIDATASQARPRPSCSSSARRAWARAGSPRSSASARRVRARRHRPRRPVRPVRRGQRLVADRRGAARRLRRRASATSGDDAQPQVLARGPCRPGRGRRSRGRPHRRRVCCYLMGYEGRLSEHRPRSAPEEASRVARSRSSTGRRPSAARRRALRDLHWADDVVLELLDGLLERLAYQPVVFVGTARRGLTERWPPPAGRHNTVVAQPRPARPARRPPSCSRRSLGPTLRPTS